MTLHTASATFWRELPRNAPSFYVASLDERTPEIVVGVFELVPFVNGPSALSVYARVGGVWQRSAGFRSDRLIAVYPIPSGDNTRAIATIETWIRADGSESELKLWKLDGNTLHRIRRADTTRFQDAEVTPTDSSVVFAVAQFPRVVDACTMCTRLDEQHEFLLVRDSVVEREYWLNPWAVIVERLYGYLARRQIAAARRLLADSADVGPLVRHHAEPEFWADSGDFERGEGFAIVLVAMPDACPSEWRIDSRRQADNSWRIVSARLGVWDGDKQQFTVRPKNELPRICS